MLPDNIFISKAQSMDDYIADVRGEIIISNIKLASIEGQNGVHDSQVLFGKVQMQGRVIVLYRSSDAYWLNIIDPNTNAVVHSINIARETGWAPRMYQRDKDTIRVLYTKNKNMVHYREFFMPEALLGAEKELLVAIKDADGKYTKPRPFTVDRFLEHCFNVTGIDYRQKKYEVFASRTGEFNSEAQRPAAG